MTNAHAFGCLRETVTFAAGFNAPNPVQTACP